MHCKYAITFALLFALSRRLWTTQPYPYSRSRLDKLPSLPGKDVTVVQLKRTVPHLTDRGQGRDDTSTTRSGQVEEAANSGLSKRSIRGVAKDVWRATRTPSTPTTILMAALWIPGTGVYLGTQVHPKVGNANSQAPFDIKLLCQAEIACNEGEFKDGKPLRPAKWHAEDVAMCMLERTLRPDGEQYPSGSYMFIYGQDSQNDKLEFKKSCGIVGRWANSYNALGNATVLHDLGTSWEIPSQR